MNDEVFLVSGWIGVVVVVMNEGVVVIAAVFIEICVDVVEKLIEVVVVFLKREREMFYFISYRFRLFILVSALHPLNARWLYTRRGFGIVS